MAEGGGLLSLPRSCRFNLPNDLHSGANAPNWGGSASFGGYALHFAPRIGRTGRSSLPSRFAAVQMSPAAIKER